MNPYGPPPPGGFGPPGGGPGGGFTPPPGAPGGYGPPGYGPPHHGPPAGYPPGASAAAPFGVHPTLGVPYSDKQKLVAGLLQILVGWGVGRFYTGHTQMAVAQLVTCLLGVFVLSWFTCFASMGVVLWPFIDGIMLLTGNQTDAEGRILR